VISPCIGICDVDLRTQVCKGCHRTLQEIAEWTTKSDDERQAIMERVVHQMFENKEE
jgi:predicted Fe-S protein YdhL (DUF1289 family)